MLIHEAQSAQKSAWPPEQLNRLLQLVEMVEVPADDTILRQHVNLIKEVDLIRKAHLKLASMGWLDWYSKRRVAELQQFVDEAKRYSPEDRSLAQIDREINYRLGLTAKMNQKDLLVYKESCSQIKCIIIITLAMLALAVIILGVVFYFFGGTVTRAYNTENCDIINFKDGSYRLVCLTAGPNQKQQIVDCPKPPNGETQSTCPVKTLEYEPRDTCDRLLAL